MNLIGFHFIVNIGNWERNVSNNLQATSLVIINYEINLNARIVKVDITRLCESRDFGSSPNMSTIFVNAGVM